jgi:hypothetical protein
VTFTAVENYAGGMGPAELQITVVHPDARYVGVGFPPDTSPTWLFLELDGAGASWTASLTPTAPGNLGLTAGTYPTRVRVGVARQDQSVIGWKDVPVTYAVRRGIMVVSSPLTFSCFAGGSAPETQGAYIEGTTGARWTATTDQPWVVVPESGYAGSFVRIGVNPAGLTVGTHEAVVTFSALGMSDTLAVTVVATAP